MLGSGALRRFLKRIRILDDPLEARPTAPIQRLPCEILDMIIESLDLCNIIALRQTCRLFYVHGSQETMAELYARGHADRSEQLIFLAFLDRDMPSSWRRRFACSLCLCFHDSGSFDADELRLPAEDRQCRSIYLCEHQVLLHRAYRRMIHATSWPYLDREWEARVREAMANDDGQILDHLCTAGPVHRCFCRARYKVMGICFAGRTELHSAWRISLQSLQRFEAAVARGDPEVPAQFNTQVCPHLRIRDCLVAGTSPSGAESSHWRQAPRSGAKAPAIRCYLKCRHCDTRTWGAFDHRILRVESRRYLGNGRRNDRAWRAQMPTLAQMAVLVRPVVGDTAG